MVSILAGLLLTAFAATADAQVPEIRFARQFSMGYLQFNVMEKHKLIEVPAGRKRFLSPGHRWREMGRTTSGDQGASS